MRILIANSVFIMSILFSSSLFANADVVKLSYGWKKGMKANVHMDSERITRKGKASVSGTIKGTYKISTEADKSGLLVNYYDTKVQVTQTGQAGAQKKMQEFINKISALSPSYVISKRGELIDVKNLDKLKKVMNVEFNKMFSNTPADAKAKLHHLINLITSKPQLMAQMSADWNRDVAQWIGAKFESGYVYKAKFSSHMPMFGNANIPTNAKYEYKGKVPCSAGQKESKCVLLSYYSSIDQDAMRPVMQGIFEKVGEKMPKGYDVEINMNVELITEPETLIPHSVKSEKIIKSPAIGKQPGQERIDRLKIVYDYQNARK